MCGPGNGMHHWTNSFWPSPMGKEQVLLTSDPLNTTDTHLSGRIYKSTSEHFWRVYKGLKRDHIHVGK